MDGNATRKSQETVRRRDKGNRTVRRGVTHLAAPQVLQDRHGMPQLVGLEHP